ncbi:hypothetical protein HanIR_Chr13g0624601 [Helianthus annuus]|nr:hypothetical protein HanIR_Chr13g0624601 [Helianthus annuus]
MNGLRENKQSSDPKVCAWSARRRHKRSGRYSCKKQTAPKSYTWYSDVVDGEPSKLTKID